MATRSSILAWRILWTEEPGGLLSIGSYRVGHDWSDLACMHALEKEMATHSSTLAWKIPWTEEPGGLLSMESQRGCNWATSLSLSIVSLDWSYFLSSCKFLRKVLEMVYSSMNVLSSTLKNCEDSKCYISHFSPHTEYIHIVNLAVKGSHDLAPPLSL